MRAGPLPEVLATAERRALAAYADFLRERFGARLRLLRLFGARLLGADADLDVVCVVDDLSPAERREVWECTGALLRAWGVVVRGMAMSSKAWQELRARGRALVLEIGRDGVDL